MEGRLKNINPDGSSEIGVLRQDICREFDPLPRLASGLLGPILWTAGREERRLANGVTYEPGPIVDCRNWAPTRVGQELGGLLANAIIPLPATDHR